MTASETVKDLKDRILLLETRIKHLSNDLQLTKEENETSMANYFELYSNMESRVEERTEQLKNVQKILERKSEELETMLDSSPAMIFYKDVERRFLRVNKRFTETTGIPVKKIVGKKYSDLFPDNKDNSLKNDLKIIESGKSLFNKKEFFETPDGKRLIVIDRIPYKDHNKRLIGFIGFAQDITDLDKAEKENRILERQLQRAQKMETVGTLAGGVAHDLNNVLSGIVGYPDLLLMNLPDDSPLRKPILAMQKSGQKASAIVQDLLTLARRGVFTTEVLNLNHIISEHLESPEHSELKKYHPDIRVMINLEEGLLNLNGSSVHLAKIVMNLVSNAAEAMPMGGDIIISTENRYIDRPLAGYDSVEEGDYVTLTIKDTGVGISPDDLEQIFEPFFSKKVMGRSGTGLGMAVVWGTVKDHKGYIDVKSIEGEGTQFIIYFPATRESISIRKTSLSINEYMGKGESILVVDDMQEQRQIALTLLSTLGYKACAVSGGNEAVDHLRNQDVDLVLLDMIMDPGIDGLDTYKKIIKLHPGQKAIIASGYSETKRVRDALILGVGRYIKKPYTLEKIGLSIKEELCRDSVIPG